MVSSRGLLRPTLVSSKPIFRFSMFMSYMYYIFLTIRIYIIQRTLVVSRVALTRWCLGKVFRPARKILKLYLVYRLISVLWLLHDAFILILVCFLTSYVFDLSILQIRNFYSLVCSFIEYVVYSLSHFPHFYVRYCRCCYRSCSFKLWWKS